jgi:uncharacterized protein YggE
VSVTGEGFVEVAPNKAEIRFSVEKEKLTAAEAKEEVDALVEGLLELFDTLEIGEEQVNSSGMRITPVYNHQHGKRVFRGFSVSRELLVTLEDLKKLEPLMEMAVKKGATHVSSPRLFHREEENLKGEAREKASADAMEKAAVLAEQFHAELGAVRSISMKPVYPEHPVAEAFGAPRAAMAFDSGGGGRDTMRLGLIKIRAQVYAVFDLDVK